jgi:hypothetical protein
MEWVAFDAFEPIGTRTTPDLLALLISLTANLYREKGKRAWLPQDILANPLLPDRLTEEEEARRTASVAADYRRLRAERLAKMAAEQEA